MTYPCALCGFALASTEIQTCQACISEVRRDLSGIEAGFALLPSMLGRPDGASLGAVMGGLSGEAALPGGDVLAMLGPGAGAGEGLPSDPPAVAFELWQWQQDWAEIRREDSKASGMRVGELVQSWHARPLQGPPSASGDCSVPALVSWLGTRLGWCMSYHPAAVDFAADMARIRFRLQSVTGTLDTPEHGASCPYCGGTLGREYLDTGRVDDWSCPRCHRAFNEAQYLLALRAALEGEAVGG